MCQTNPSSPNSNPVEHVVPVTAGVDESLSNIHLSTPEKAGLDIDLTSLEDTGPSVAVSKMTTMKNLNNFVK